MTIGNFQFELADLRAETEREAGIARARAALKRPGRLVCDCGAEISNARRQALPSADTCIDCATRAQRLRRRKA